jgi:hypothetical protein
MKALFRQLKRVLSKSATMHLIGIITKLNRRMTDAQFARNMLANPLHLQQQINLLMVTSEHRVYVRAVLRSVSGYLSSLNYPVTP